MSAMKREKQYDMFDVATGACTLLDYLFQRYSENDLSTTFWVDPKDEVDELLAPAPLPDGRPGSEPVIRPVQGPKAPPRVALRPFGPPLPPEEEAKEIPPQAPAPSSDPGAIQVSTNTAVQPPAVDGLDGLVKKVPEAQTPGYETFRRTEQQSGPSPDSFQAQQPETTEPSPSAESAAAGPSPAAPSMDELLAQFHRATQDYHQRNQLLAQIDSEATEASEKRPESENPDQESSS